jgi:hypothetical protein
LQFTVLPVWDRGVTSISTRFLGISILLYATTRPFAAIRE